MPLSENTEQIQTEFVEFIRGERGELNGDLSLPQNVNQYKRLTHNILRNTLKGNYPILNKRIGSEKMDEWVQQFIENHPIQEHRLWKLPWEFLHYCIHQIPDGFNEELKGLMFYEWEDVALFTQPETNADIWKNRRKNYPDTFWIIKNEEVRLHVLQYPYYKAFKEIDFTKDLGHYYVMLYRNTENLKIHQMVISAVEAFILENVIKESYTIYQIKEAITELFEIPEEKASPIFTALKEKLIQRNLFVL